MKTTALAALFVIGCAVGEAPGAGGGGGGGGGAIDPGSQTADGEPAGPHYLLHIIGVPNNSQVNVSGDNAIYLPDNGGGRAQVQPGDFAVVDPDGVNHAATFRLPNPISPGATTYSIWARAYQEPTSGQCFTQQDGTRYCRLSATVSVGSQGMQNIASRLVSIDGISVFDDSFKDVYWQDDNSNTEDVKIRFYQAQ